MVVGLTSSQPLLSFSPVQFSTTPVIQRMRRFFASSFIYIALLFLAHITARAAEEAMPASSVARYEQMLLKTPAEGTAFDKVFQFYQAGAGLEQLDKDWEKKAEADPANAAGYFTLRALLAERRNQSEIAATLYQKAIELNPSDFRAQFLQGNLRLREGKMADAINHFEAALKTNPPANDKAELLRRLGQAHQRNLDSTAALAVWKRMVDEFPDDTFALTEAGRALLEADQFDEARQVFTKLVELTEAGTPARIQAQIQAAEVDERAGKKDTAVAQYEKLLAEVSDTSWLNRDLRSRIEQVYRRQDDLPALSQFYTRRLETYPNDVESALRHSRVLTELNKKEQALELLKKAAALAPDRIPLQLELAGALSNSNDIPGAEKILSTLAAKDPADLRYWELLADTQLKRHSPPTPEDRATALESLRKLAGPEVKKSNQIIRLASALQARSYREEAIAEYMRALALEPSAADARMQCADLLVVLNRREEAWKLLEQMVAGELATPPNYNRLALTWQKYTLNDRSLAAIESGLQLDPKNFELLWTKSRLLADEKKWPEVIALTDPLLDAAPNDYFAEQIESRYPSLLTSAGTLDATYSGLKERIGGSTPLSEREMRLLARLQIQKGDEAGFRQLMEEAHRVYPKSHGLLRIEFTYLRSLGALEQSIAVAEKLIELQPEQKSELLPEIARMQRDSAQIDAALATAQRQIDANPASPDGYLLYAELAVDGNRQQEAIGKLKQAVKLSDRPNQIRTRLAQVYRDLDQLQKATETCEEAFEAAETPQDKIGLIPSLVQAYFAQDRINELIERFRNRQQSEEGGWRYGLYLAEIFEELQDFGSARRELSRSLAARPEDPALLKQLVSMADKESNPAEQLRYQELLTQFDPAMDEQINLAKLYCELDRTSDAAQIVRRNAVALQKDPFVWSEVLAALSKSEAAAEIRAILSSGTATEDAGRMLSLAEMQIAAGENPEELLWRVFALPVPPEPSPPMPARRASSRMRMWNTSVSPQFMRRWQSGHSYRNSFQLLSNRTTGRSRRYVGQNRAVGAAGSQCHDRAIIYLAQLAIQNSKPDEFLKRLEEEMERQGATAEERLLIYELCEAGPAIISELKKVAAMENPDEALLGLACMEQQQLETMHRFNNSAGGNLEEISRIGDTLRAQTVKNNPKMAAMSLLSGLFFAPSEEKEKRKKEVVELLEKTTDISDPDEITLSLMAAGLTRYWEGTDRYLKLLEAMDPAKIKSLTVDLIYFPLQVINVQSSGGSQVDSNVDPKKFAEVTVRCLKLICPKSVRTASYTSSASSSSGGSIQNRYLPHPVVEQLLMQIGSVEAIRTAFLASLEEWIAQTEEPQKNSPRMIKARLCQLSGKPELALPEYEKIVASDPADDTKILLANLYNEAKRPADALKLLESLKSRYGPMYAEAQREILRAAKLNKDTETARKVALRLTSFKMSDEQRQLLAADLEELGLKEKADALRTQNANLRTVSGSGDPVEVQLIKDLQELRTKKDRKKGLALAEQALRRPISSRYGDQARELAIQVFRDTGTIDKGIALARKELELAPDSGIWNLNLGLLINGKTGPLFFQPDTPTPFWMRLKRQGNKFSGAYSSDGTQWFDLETQELNLPPKVYVGIIASSHDPELRMSATVDQVTVTRPDGSTVEDPWQHSEIGQPNTPSTFEEKEGTMHFKTDGGDLWNQEDIAHFAWREVEGDCEITAHVTQFEGDHEYAKLAVMFRESLDAGARNISTNASHRRGFNMQRRTEEKKNTGSFASGGLFETPYWIQLERKDDQVIGRYSKDGQSWEVLRSITIPREAQLGVGFLAWQNGKNSTMTAKLEDITSEFPADAGEWTQEEAKGAVQPAVFKLEGTTANITGPPPGNDHSHAFYYRKVCGDARITARVTEFSTTDKPHSFIGLGLQQLDSAKKLPRFSVSPRSGKNVAVRLEEDYAGQARQYLTRAAELDKSPETSRRLLQQFIRTDKMAARGIAVQQLKSNPEQLIESFGYQLVDLFSDPDGLPDLIKALESLSPPPPNPNGSSLGNGFINMAEDCLSKGKLEEGIQIVNAGLRLAESYYISQLQTAKVRLLMRQERFEEAKTVLLETARGKKSSQPATQSKLGFNQSYSSSNLISGSTYSSGVVESPFLYLVSFALQMGLMEEFEKTLHSNTSLAPDERNTALVLCSIVARDLATTKKRLQELKGASNNENLLLQELSRWKQKDLFTEIKSKNNPPPYVGSFQEYVDLYYYLLLDDPALTGSAIEKYLPVMIRGAEQARSRRTYFPEDVAMNFIYTLVESGKLEECRRLLSLLAEIPMSGYSRNTGQPHPIKDVIRWLDFQEKPEGEVKLLAAWAGLSTTSNQHRLVWETIPGWLNSKKDSDTTRFVPFFVATPAANQGTLEGGTLKIYSADQKEAAPLKTIPLKGVIGEAALKIPPKVSKIRVALCSKEKELDSVELPVCSSPNLIPNPEFRNDKPEIFVPDWKKLIEFQLCRFSRGPVAGTTATSWIVPNQNEVATSKPITIDPTRTYLFSGWCYQPFGSYGQPISINFLDANGRFIATRSLSESSYAGWKWSCVRIYPRGTPANNETVAWPEQATAAEITFHPTQSLSKLAELSLNMLETSEPALPAASPQPSKEPRRRIIQQN